MRMWLDTEFMEDGKTIELLSIGIVREDGAEYYAVSGDADYSKATDWVRAHVIPKLGMGSRKSRTQIRAEVEAFVRADGTKPEVWAYFADYDWVVFCQLFGRMIDLPAGFPRWCRDVKQLCVEVGDPDLPPQAKDEHNALVDARWTRSAWLFCDDRRQRMASLLSEWLNTPYWATQEQWEAWVKDFRPRVEKCLEK